MYNTRRGWGQNIQPSNPNSKLLLEVQIEILSGKLVYISENSLQNYNKRTTLPLPNKNTFMSKWYLKIQPLRGICKDLRFISYKNARAWIDQTFEFLKLTFRQVKLTVCKIKWKRNSEKIPTSSTLTVLYLWLAFIKQWLRADWFCDNLHVISSW